MTYHRKKIVGMAIVAATTFTAGQLLRPTIENTRQNWDLVYEPIAQNSKQPTYRVIESMGSFRGLAIHAMWHRLESLQAEGRIFEADALSRRIAELQPRMPQVWRYISWNMAYNISVMCNDQSERWLWIDNAIRLLREEGIPNNPEAKELYRELSWTYMHKLGGVSDDANRYYRIQLAKRWQLLMGSSLNGWSQTNNEWRCISQIRPLADFTTNYLLDGENIAQKWTEEKQAVWQNNHPEAWQLWQDIEQSLTENSLPLPAFNEEAIDLLGRLRSATTSPAFMQWNGTDQIPEALANYLGSEGIAALNALLNSDNKGHLYDLVVAIQACALVYQERIDPTMMVTIMERYGPVDWRHPAAHALYWSYAGSLVDEFGGINDSYAALNTDRLIIQATQGLFDGGIVQYDPITGFFSEEPDPRFTEYYVRGMLRTRCRLAARIIEYLPDNAYEIYLKMMNNEASRLTYIEGIESWLADELNAEHALRDEVTEALSYFTQNNVGLFPRQSFENILNAYAMDIYSMRAFEKTFDELARSGQIPGVLTELRKEITTSFPNFELGDENFRHRAVVFCYIYGSTEEAQRQYDILRELYDMNGTEWQDEGSYEQTLHQFVVSALGYLPMPSRNQALIRGLVFQSMLVQYVVGDSLTASGLYTAASNARDLLVQENQENQTGAAPGITHGRMEIASMETYREWGIAELLRTPRVSLRQRSDIYATIGVRAREVLWNGSFGPRTMADLSQQCEEEGLDLQTLFPPPQN